MSESELIKRIEILENKVAELEKTLSTIGMMEKSERISEYLKKRERNQKFVSLVNAVADEEFAIKDSEQENEKRLAEERQRLERQIREAISSENNNVTYNVENEQLFSISEYSYGVQITGYNGFNPNTIVVPSTIKGKTVRKIGDKAFSNISCQSIVLPDTVREIGNEAFGNSQNLQSIKLGKQVKIIGERAFSYCKKLKNINLPDNLKQLGNSCFSYTEIEKIIIPGSLNTIPSWCFSHCSQLKEIVISEGVTYVKNMAFEKCNLNEIIFPKSMLSVYIELFGTSLGIGKCKLVFLGNNTDWEHNKYNMDRHMVYCAFGSKILQSSRQLGCEVHPISEFFENR